MKLLFKLGIYTCEKKFFLFFSFFLFFLFFLFDDGCHGLGTVLCITWNTGELPLQNYEKEFRDEAVEDEANR